MEEGDREFLDSAENLPVPFSVRPAQPGDAPVAATLMYMSGPETALAMFGPRKEQALAVLRFLFRGKRHQFSYEHACVAELNGRVVGLALGISGQEWKAIGEATGRELGGELRRRLGLLRFLRLLRSTITLARSFPHPRPEDFFVQMLAVLPQAHRRGVGRRLLASMEERARKAGSRRVALDVLMENESARAFYRALGFTEEFAVQSPAITRRFGVRGRLRLTKEARGSSQAEECPPR